jgi:hypothetical protein
MPDPSPVGQFAVTAGETAVKIPLLFDSGRSVRANLSLDTALLAGIDEAAGVRGLTRSAFIASTAREKIMAEGQKIMAEGQKIMAEGQWMTSDINKRWPLAGVAAPASTGAPK